MGRSFSLATLAAALLIGGSAVATAQSVNSAGGNPGNAPAPNANNLASQDEIVCRKIAVTGQLLPSRFGKICHTRAEWEEIQHQSQDQVERAQQVSGAHPAS